MSDQQRWFKLWHSALSDDRISALPPALRWAWVALGAHTKVHGEAGKVTVSSSNRVLASAMGVPIRSLISTIKRLPHMVVEEGQKCNGEFTVTWSKWRYFQEDSTATERQRLSRSKRRGEEKRGDQKRTTPLPPPRTDAVTPELQPPELQPAHPPDPTGPLDCASCQRVLVRLNERTARTYNAPGQVGRMLHDRHVEHGVETCIRVIELKVEECQRDPKGWKFLAPNVLFKPENFDMYRNQGPAVTEESDSVRRFRERLKQNPEAN